LNGAKLTKTETKPNENAFLHSEYFNLIEFCSYWEEFLKKANINHVKISSKNNYLIIELTEYMEFSLEESYKTVTEERKRDTVQSHQLISTETKTETHTVKIQNKWFGFKQKTFTKKGKYYSKTPLRFYRTDIFLRCNLINKQSTFYNNEPSYILYILPVEDGDQIKAQIYFSTNNIKINSKLTNHLNL
jgi:hypothetical protein